MHGNPGQVNSPDPFSLVVAQAHNDPAFEFRSCKERLNGPPKAVTSAKL